MKLLEAASLRVTAIRRSPHTETLSGVAACATRTSSNRGTQGFGAQRVACECMIFPPSRIHILLVLALISYASISVHLIQVYTVDSPTPQRRRIYREKPRDEEREKDGLHCGYVEKEEEDFCVETVVIQEPYSCLKKEKQINCRPTITAAPRICHKVGVRWTTKVCTLVDYELKCTQRLVDKQEKCVKEWMIQQPYPCALSSTVESCKTADTPMKDQCTRSIIKSVPYTCIKEELGTFCDGHPAFVTGHPGGSMVVGDASQEASLKKKDRITPFKILRKLRYLEANSIQRLAGTKLDDAPFAGNAGGHGKEQKRTPRQGGEAAATRDASTCLEKKEQHVPYRCSRSKAKPECKTVKRKETAPCIKDKPVISTYDCSYTEVQLFCGKPAQNHLGNSTEEGQQGGSTEAGQRGQSKGDDANQGQNRIRHEPPTHDASHGNSAASEKVQSEENSAAEITATRGNIDDERDPRDLRRAIGNKFVPYTRTTSFPSTAVGSYASAQKDCYYAPVTVERTCKEILMRRTEEKCEIDSEEMICKTIKEDQPQICYMKKTTEESVNCDAQQHLTGTAAEGSTTYALPRAPRKAATIENAASGAAAPVKAGNTAGIAASVLETSAPSATRPRILSAPPNCVTRVVARKDTCTKRLPFTEKFPCTSTVPVTTCSPSRNVDATTCYRAVQKSMEYSCVKPAKVEECVPVPIHRQGTCYEQEEYKEAFECEETQVQQVCKEEEIEVHSQCMKTVQRELSFPCLKKKQIRNCTVDGILYSPPAENEQLFPQELLPQQLSPSQQWPTMPQKGVPVIVAQTFPRHPASESTLHGASAEQVTEEIASHSQQDEQLSLSAVRFAVFNALALVQSAVAAAAEAAADPEEVDPVVSAATQVTAGGEAHTAHLEAKASTEPETAGKTISPGEPLETISPPTPCPAESMSSTTSSSESSVCGSISSISHTSTATKSPNGMSSSGGARRSSRSNKSKSVSIPGTSRSSPSSRTKGETGAPARRLLPSFKPLGLKAKKPPPFSPTTTQLPPSPPPANRIFLGPRGHLLKGGVETGHALPAAEPHVHNTPNPPIVLPDSATVERSDLLSQHRKYTLTSADQILPHIPPKILPAAVLNHQHHPPLLVDGHIQSGTPAQHLHHVVPVVQPHAAAILTPPVHHVSPATQETETLVTELKPVAPLRPGSPVPSLLEADISPPWLSSHLPVKAEIQEQQKERAAVVPVPLTAEEEVSLDSSDPTHKPVTHPVVTTPLPSTEEHVALVHPSPHPYHHPGAGVLPLGYPLNVGVPAGVAPLAAAPPGVIASPEWMVTAPAAVLPPAAAVYPAAGPVPAATHAYPHPFPYAHAAAGAFPHVGAGVSVTDPYHRLVPHHPLADAPGVHEFKAGLPSSPLVAPNYFPYPHMEPSPTGITGPAGIPDVMPMYPHQRHTHNSVLQPPTAVSQPSHPLHVPFMDNGQPYHESVGVIQKPSQLQEILIPARSALPEFHKLQELTAEIHFLMKLQRQQKGRLSESHRERLKQITVELEDLAGIQSFIPEAVEASDDDEHFNGEREYEQSSRRQPTDRCNHNEPPSAEPTKKRCETPRSRSRQPAGAGSTKNPAEANYSNRQTSFVDDRKSSNGSDRGSSQTATGKDKKKRDVGTHKNTQHAALAGGKQRVTAPRKSGVDSEELKHVLSALLAELEADELALFEELRKPGITAEDAEELTGELSLLREDIRIVADGRARLITGELSYEEIQNLWAFLLGEASPGHDTPDASLQEGDETQEGGAVLQNTDEEEDEPRAAERQAPAGEKNSSGPTSPPSKGADLLGVSAESAALAAAAAALHKVMTATFARIPLIAHHLPPDNWDETHMYDNTYAAVHLDAPVPLKAPSTTVPPVPPTSSLTHVPALHHYPQQHHLHQAPHHHHSIVGHTESLGAREAILAAALKGAFEIKTRIMDSIHALQQLLDTTDMPLEREVEAKQLLSALQRDLLRVQQLVGRLQHGKGLSTEDLQYISTQLEAVNGSAQASGQPTSSDVGPEGEYEGTAGGEERGVAATEGGSNIRLNPDTDTTLGRTRLSGEAGVLSPAELERGQPQLSSPPVNPLALAAYPGGAASSEGAPARTNVYITINIDENGDLDVVSPRRKDG